MRTLLVILLSAAVLPVAAHAETLPACTLGLHVDSAGGTNEPGVITQVDQAQGAYLVHYDNSTIEEWMSARWLGHSCKGVASGAKDIDFFIDNWDQVFQQGEPDLVIHSDHTYEWLTAIEPPTVVKGGWHEATADQLGSNAVGPGVVLEKALYDRDWVIQSEGDVDQNDRETILAQDDDLDYYYFYRSRVAATD
jgi:hypothetical protein